MAVATSEHRDQGPSTLIKRIRYGSLVFVGSVACGYGSFYVYYISSVNRGFGGKTDIIGYPSFYNYNNNALFYGYLLGLLAAVGSLLALIRFVDLQTLEGFLSRLIPIALVSPIVAFAVALKSNGTWYGWAIIAFVALALFKVVASLIDHQRKAQGKSALAECALSVVVAATVPALLFYISENTGWGTGPHDIFHIRWFPVPILIAAELFVVALVIHCLRGTEGAQLFDKYLVRVILIPTLIYCLTATLPGTRVLDDFHGGEKLAPLSLGLRGSVPWRDFLFIHGVWDDFLQLYIPARMWEASPRAGLAGPPLLFGPIYWISFYAFFLIVFEFSLLPALIAFFISISLFVPDPTQIENLFAFRFFLYPAVLISLYKALRSKAMILWVLFIALCGIQVLLAPEFALLTLCFGFVIFLRDLLARDSRQSWAKQFHPTLVCGISTAVFITLAGWLLSARGLLGGFLMMAVQLSRGHLQTGAIPVAPIENLLWVTAIPLLFILGSTFVFARALVSSGRRVPAVVWLLWTISLCTAIYYPKYIGRPDNHIAEVFVFAEPGIALLTVFLLEEGRRSLQPRYPTWVLTGAGLFFLSLVLVYKIPGDVFQPRPWFDYFIDAAGSFRGRFITTNTNKDFAGLNASTTPGAKVTALRQFFDAHLHDGDAVFDFSDSPTTFYAILQLKPASRFIHVSLAIQEELQREVVKDLEKSHPPYVIYQSDGGLNGWDGIPNEVRHYVIARYVNLHYAYDRTIDGSIIFRRADLPAELLNDGGPMSLSACPLGDVPNFFSSRAPLNGRENALATEPTITKYLQLVGWAALPGDHSPPELLVSYNGTVLDRFEPNRSRPDVDKTFGRSLGPTGFSRHIALPNQVISAKDIEISGKSASSGKLYHFQEGPLRGWVDSSIVTYAVSLLSPHRERPAYLALQLTASGNREPQEFSIISPQTPDATVTFTRIAGHNELLLPLGGCYAWGAISKSVPQITSSKAFTLKSGLYYYE